MAKADEMTIPHQNHRFSLEDCEFVIATRKFYPSIRNVVVVSVAIGILTFLGGWELKLELWVNILAAVAATAFSLVVAPVLFQFKSGQLATENYLLGNITSVMGHVNWPPTWQNVLTERAVTFNWSEIEDVILRPAPWVIALDNLVLELNFHDGRHRIMRVPNLAPHEVDGFIQVLKLIALRRGFHFREGPPLHPPLHSW